MRKGKISQNDYHVFDLRKPADVVRRNRSRRFPCVVHEEVCEKNGESHWVWNVFIPGSVNDPEKHLARQSFSDGFYKQHHRLPTADEIPTNLEPRRFRERFARQSDAELRMIERLNEILGERQKLGTLFTPERRRYAEVATEMLMKLDPTSTLVDVVVMHAEALKRRAVTLHDAFALTKDQYRARGKTKNTNSYYSQLVSLENVLSESLDLSRPAESFSPLELRGALSSSGNKANTLNVKINYLHAVYRVAIENTPIRDNPVKNIRRFKEGRIEDPPVLTNEQFLQLLDAAKKHDPDLIPTISAQFGLFLRTAEAANLSLELYNPAAPTIFLPKSLVKRGASTRRVYIRPFVRGYLNKWATTGESFLYRSKHTEYEARARELSDRLIKLKDKAGISTWTKDILRKTGISSLFALGFEVQPIADECGHAETKLTQERYINGNMRADDALRMWLALEESQAPLKVSSLEDIMVNPTQRHSIHLNPIPTGFSHPNLIVETTTSRKE